MENRYLKQFTRILVLVFGIMVVQNYSGLLAGTQPIKKKPRILGFWKKTRGKVQNFFGIKKNNAQENGMNDELNKNGENDYKEDSQEDEGFDQEHDQEMNEDSEENDEEIDPQDGQEIEDNDEDYVDEENDEV